MNFKEEKKQLFRLCLLIENFEVKKIEKKNITQKIKNRFKINKLFLKVILFIFLILNNFKMNKILIIFNYI